MTVEYVLNRVFEHFNLKSEPNITTITKKELVEKAWEDTGKHLRKALDSNADRPQKRNRSSK